MAEQITSRRFGPAFEHKCGRPEVIVCALWECQSAGLCKYSQRAGMAKILEHQAERPIGIQPVPRKETRE